MTTSVMASAALWSITRHKRMARGSTNERLLSCGARFCCAIIETHSGRARYNCLLSRCFIHRKLHDTVSSIPGSWLSDE